MEAVTGYYFIARWKTVDLKERAAYQEHFLVLYAARAKADKL